MEYPKPESFVEPDLLCRLPKPRRLAQRGHPEEDVITSELSRLAAEEYFEDFMCHMNEMEMKTLPDVSKIDKQSEIKWCMRPYLIEFLVNAHACLDLSTETLFLTVNLLDRYCSKRQVYKVHYQLVGCAALLIACKYGDKTYGIPKIGLLEKFCCNFYPRRLFIEMEMNVLDSIDWIIGYPSVNFFLQVMVAENGDDQEVEHMATYICEIATYYNEFISTKPSTMARLALVSARVILCRSEVDKADFDRVGSDSLSTLSLCLHQPPTTLFNKYSRSDLSEVSRKLNKIMSEQANRNAAPGFGTSSRPRRPSPRHRRRLKQTPMLQRVPKSYTDSRPCCITRFGGTSDLNSQANSLISAQRVVKPERHGNAEDHSFVVLYENVIKSTVKLRSELGINASLAKSHKKGNKSLLRIKRGFIGRTTKPPLA